MLHPGFHLLIKLDQFRSNPQQMRRLMHLEITQSRMLHRPFHSATEHQGDGQSYKCSKSFTLHTFCIMIYSWLFNFYILLFCLYTLFFVLYIMVIMVYILLFSFYTLLLYLSHYCLLYTHRISSFCTLINGCLVFTYYYFIYTHCYLFCTC